MANSRMFLCHRPSGLAVFLGKRMAHGWYGTPADLGSQVLELFERVWANDEPNHFCIAMEQTDGAPLAVEYDGMAAGPAMGLITLTGLATPTDRAQASSARLADRAIDNARAALAKRSQQ